MATVLRILPALLLALLLGAAATSPRPSEVAAVTQQAEHLTVGAA